MTVGEISLLLQENRAFMQIKVLKMNPPDARNAEQPKKEQEVAREENYMMQYVQNVAVKHRYRSNQPAENLSIVEIVIENNSLKGY